MSVPRSAVCSRTVITILVLAASSLNPADASKDELMRNWFDDPFVQVSRAIEGCLEPVGPRMTVQERRTQAHQRPRRNAAR